MKKFLIIDGNSIANRAFYGIRPLSNKDGLPTNAVYGFLNILKKHMDAIQPDYMACAFDVHQPTFRHIQYSNYKGTRKGMPEELKVQMPYIQRAAEYLGYKIIECPGFEADDIIGTAAFMAENNGIDTFIVTGDRDSLQLITDMTTVVLAKNKEDLYVTPEEFEKTYGIKPSQFVDVKALMGDSSDNIPGVSGIGEKTAFRLIQSSGSLDELYGNAENGYFGQTSSVVKKLDAGRDSAYMSRELALIRRDAPICPAEELFAVREVMGDEFCDLCGKLEFNAMVKRFGIIPSGSFSGSDSGVKENKKAEIRVNQVGSLNGINGGLFAFYYDGTDAAYTENGVDVFVKNSAEASEICEFIRNNRIICHDFKSLLRTLHISGDEVDCVFDVMLGAYLINSGEGKYTIDNVLQEYSSFTPDNTAESVCALYLISKDMEKTIEERGMTSLMREIEIPLSRVLAEMEEIGFKIDPEGIVSYAHELLIQENTLADAIWAQAGRQFNINSPRQLGEVLFEDLGLPSGRKTKTGYSTNAETLEELRPYHTIISDILLYRQTAKLRGTYGENLASQADANGRIHTKLNQTGTATGRLASSDPNLQNIPVRIDMGRELRRFFITDDGYVLIDADYSQIELRLLAALSKDKVMGQAFIDGEDIHAAVASQVFGVDQDEVTPEQRRRAKAVNFGIVYGIGEFSLAKDLGIPRRVAKEYIQNYLSTYSGVDRYLKETVAKAKEDGYTTTMFSRRRNIPELSASNKNVKAFGERVAMNSPIQGSAADVIKIAMINVNRALKEAKIDARLIMQVHDELIVEASESCADQAAEILVREMESAVRLSVPLTADCGVGRNWLEAK